MRFSLRSGAGDTRANVIRVRQRGQLERSMGIRDEGMVLTLDQAGALPNSLSPKVAKDDGGRGGDASDANFQLNLLSVRCRTRIKFI
jgi:hypothetical protein